ncbi:MAG: glycine oxidase ThiO [Frankiaceae bacterium]|nr:glycine oxidase ThiO [Frankiaceae bacterium]MBV9872689.1 glycine oxidase ThiO [Frankiaceae bacterium]
MTTRPAAASGTTHADVAVIGAGIVGLAAAWRLSQRGLRVALVDPSPAAAATHAAAGMLAPVSEVRYGETALLRLGMASLARYPDLVAELEASTGVVVGLRREGTLIVATDAGDRDLLNELQAFQTSLGLSATLLTSHECRGLEPMLAPEIRCGLLAASDHSVDNRRLAAALLAAISATDVDLVSATVASVTTHGDRAIGVTLAGGGQITAATTVLAAGPWCATLPGIPDDARPPVRPVKGEILRLRTRPNTALPGHSIRGFVNGHEIYLVPRADGELVVGATVEDAGFDTSVRAGAVREMLRDARAVMPSIDELELVEAIAALRPGSPDNAPMIGPTGLDGLLVATGHHRNGILLAAITADLVADLVSGESVDRELLEAVSPQRFALTRTSS